MSLTLAERLQSLGQIASLVNSGSELAEILERIALAVCQRSAWSSSAIMAIDEASGFSVQVARHDPLFPASPARPERWELATSPSRLVLEAQEPLVIADAQEARDFPGYQRDAKARDYRTVVLLPMSAVDEEGRGMVMSVHAHHRLEVESDELAFLQTVAHLASLAVDKAHRLRLETQQNARLREALEIHAAAMEQVLAGNTLGDLAALAERHLPLPIVLVDLTANQAIGGRSPLAATIEDTAWRETVDARGFKPLGALVRAAESGHFGQWREISLRPLGVEASADAIIEPCIVEGATLGGMILFTAGRPLEANEALIAEELRFALAVVLMRAQVRFAAQAETHGEFLARLFSGNWRDREETLARARHLGLRLEAPAQLAVLGFPSDAVALDAARRADVERSLLRTAQQGLPGATAFFDGDAFALFLPQDRRTARTVPTLLQRMIDEVQWRAGDTPIVALSRACESLEDYRLARQDGARLIDLARRLGRRGLVAAEDFGPFARLVAAADQEALRSFVAETLGRLDAHDRKRGGSLLPTLEAFLGQFSRYQATADVLGIHVTTLRYRLKRLKELFGIDLEDAETRVALEVALRVRQALPGGASPPMNHSIDKQ